MIRTINFFILLFYFTFSYSQTYLCLNAGFNYSRLTDKDPNQSKYGEIKFESKRSFSLGASIKKCIYGNIDCSLGLTYNNYSANVMNQFSTNGFSTLSNYNLTLCYYSISLLPEYSLGNKIMLFTNLGPYFSFLENSKKNGIATTTMTNRKIYTYEITGSARGYFRNTDYGLLGSIGLKFKIHEILYVLPQLRYNIGKYDISNMSYPLINIRSVSYLIELNFQL